MILLVTFTQPDNKYRITQVTSSTLDSHLLQQRSGLLWNRLGDVESGVATNSCWMAPQQWLYRGKEGWKEQITINENKENLSWRDRYTDTRRAKINVRAPETGQIGGGPRARAPETTLIPPTTTRWWFNYCCSFSELPCVSQKEWHCLCVIHRLYPATLLEGPTVKQQCF